MTPSCRGCSTRSTCPSTSTRSTPTWSSCSARTPTHALRRVLEYFVYRDLKRGWRVTSPNLEQCGLLDIEYRSARRLCRGRGALVRTSSMSARWHRACHRRRPRARAKCESVCQVLLDVLRRELAIRVDVLEPRRERRSPPRNQYLNKPWTLDDLDAVCSDEARRVPTRAEHPAQGTAIAIVFLSARGGFGLFSVERGRSHTSRRSSRSMTPSV